MKLNNFSAVAALVLLTTLLLGACATTQGPYVNDGQDLQGINNPKARRQLRTGDALGASNTYSELAAKTTDPLKQQDYLLIAAEILYDRGLVEPAAAKLAAIPGQLATDDLQHRLMIVNAKDAMLNSDPERALGLLPDPQTVTSPLHRARVFEVRAQSYRQLQNPDEELLARLALEQELDNPDIVDRNHVQIWQLLTTQPLSTLDQMTTNVRGEAYQGWIELALANARGGVNAQQRETNLLSWRERFPTHPASPRFVDRLFTAERFGGFAMSASEIRQVGVLLPLGSEGIGAVAEAIRDGIVINLQNTSGEAAPVVRFYDTGDSPALARAAFQTALQEGADAIIGPLRKESVTAILTLRNIPVPVITLNYVDAVPGAQVHQNVLQFGLAPEDEARSAALRSLALNYRKAIVLQSDDSRGDREARAFTELMMLNGGEVLHTGVLPLEEYDYSRQLKDALLISQGDQRFRRISRVIGEKLFFEPSIRDDVDMVFLALTSEQAQSVRPQLAFFHAAKLPLLATSRVALAEDDARARQDLNGIFYADAPWILDSGVKESSVYRQVRRNFPQGMELFSKLYALGADAWTLLTRLQELSENPELRIPGYTGELTLAPDRRVERSLLWAQYQEGKSISVRNVEFSSPVFGRFGPAQ